MITKDYFLKKIKDVKFTDFISLIPMMIAIVIKPIYGAKYKETWLICEDKNEARDNGYWFFYYLRRNHPNLHCVYAINRDSVDYKKVKVLGEVIQYGSIKHWLLYFSCKFNISSQKGGKPNSALCAFLELNNLFVPKNIFLQHGIIINDTKWLYAKNSRFSMFVTSILPEKVFVEKNFGFKEEVIKLTGLPRFDNLHHDRTIKNRILIMPTWRAWFNLSSKQNSGLECNFKMSKYYHSWKEFLESEKLSNLIDEFDLEIIFYPHRNMQRFLDDFSKNTKTKVKIASWENYDIQYLLSTSSIMITDYSSVFFDMVYQKKPVIFYQFDNDEFREYQYSEGYFDYFNNSFGKSFTDKDLVIKELEIIIRNGCKCSKEYLAAHSEYFLHYDANNSERIFNILCNQKLE